MSLHKQLNPYLETCCLHMSANASYEQAVQDMNTLLECECLPGCKVRLVHRQEFCSATVESEVKKLSAGGGTFACDPLWENPACGKACIAVCLHESDVAATRGYNPQLLIVGAAPTVGSNSDRLRRRPRWCLESAPTDAAKRIAAGSPRVGFI